MKKIPLILSSLIFLGTIGTLVVFKVLEKQEQYIGAEVNALSLISEKVDKINTDVGIIETNYKLTNPKYLQILKTTDQNTGQKYEVHEYVTSKGEAGYQIIFYNSDGSIESKGYGVEALSRTGLTLAPIITPSSTPK